MCYEKVINRLAHWVVGQRTCLLQIDIVSSASAIARLILSMRTGTPLSRDLVSLPSKSLRSIDTFHMNIA